MKILSAVVVAILLSFGVCQAESTVYVGSLLMHYDTGESRNDEGFNPSLGYSYGLRGAGFLFDTGATIFTDSYSQPSATIFSNVSHEKFTYKYVTPILALGVVSKGSSYEDDDRQVYPYILPKVKIGESTGLFLMLTASPEWAAMEVGYAW